MRPSAISLFSDRPGDFPAHRIKAADDDDAGRVVDDHVDASFFFERANIATFATDDPALHIVVGNVDRAGRGIGSVGCGKALSGHHQDFAGLSITISCIFFSCLRIRLPTSLVSSSSSSFSSRLVASSLLSPVISCSFFLCFSKISCRSRSC